MRKIIIFLFVAMLAAQSVYAAAARYCEHESDAGSSSHVGHHGHEHEPALSDEPSSPHAVHLDCAFCQLAFAPSLSSLGIALNLAIASAVLADDSPRINSADRDDFLRPPQARAA